MHIIISRKNTKNNPISIAKKTGELKWNTKKKKNVINQKKLVRKRRNRGTNWGVGRGTEEVNKRQQNNRLKCNNIPNYIKCK